ncbi:MAG: TIR domain-containing protein [Neobacillus sp.]
MNKLEIIDSLINLAETLRYSDSKKSSELKRRSAMIIRNIFGENSIHLDTLSKIDFFPVASPANEESYQSKWYSGRGEITNLFNLMREEIAIFHVTNDDTKTSLISSEKGSQIFIVHGHDNEMKQSVARFIEKLGLEPIILHEQSDEGRTIIEKFEDSSSRAFFAIVLLSPDDFVSSLANESQKMYRARQNVIFELGYFIGKLGRKSVFVLHKQIGNFEMPSDYAGVLYTPYDEESWKFKLAKELKACEYTIDLNKLV